MTATLSPTSPPAPVRLTSAREGPEDLVAAAAGAAGAAAGDPRAALALAVRLGVDAPRPGTGATATLWELLATLGAADLTVARAVEPHLDALAILGEAADAGEPVDLGRVGAGPESTWGVFAAEGAGTRLDAACETTPDGPVWRLSGRKPWCSLGGLLSHAVVTAHLPGDGGRRAFVVALTGPAVRPVEGAWVARGLTDVPSGPLDLDGAEAVPVGGEGWYLTRPGFAWGGAGVAACWFGAAVALARRMARQAEERRLDQVGQMHLGAVDATLHAARVVLADAARAVDAGEATGGAGAATAHRVRRVVARACEDVLTRAGHALGPGPLALEAEHAARVADLGLYLRQDHAERDEAALGRAVLEDATAAWETR